MTISVKANSATFDLLEKFDVTDTSAGSIISVRAVTMGNVVLYRCAGYPTSQMTANTEYTIATGVSAAIASVTHFFPQSTSSSGLVIRVSVTAAGEVKIRPSANVSTTTGINFEVMLPKAL